MTSRGLTAVRDTIPATAPLNKNLAVVASCHAHWNPHPTLRRIAYHKATKPPFLTNSYDEEAAISAEPNDEAATAETVETAVTDDDPPRTDVVVVVGEATKARRLRRWCGPGRDGTAAASTPRTFEVDEEEETTAAVATSTAASFIQRGFLPWKDDEPPSPSWEGPEVEWKEEARPWSRGGMPLTVLVGGLVLLVMLMLVAGPLV